MARRGLGGRPPQQLWQADQVVGSGCQGEGPGDAWQATMFGLAESRSRFDPAKHFLDPFASTLAGLISAMTCRAAVHGRAPRGAGLADPSVGGDMGRDVALAQGTDEAGGVVALVGPERDASAG